MSYPHFGPKNTHSNFFSITDTFQFPVFYSAVFYASTAYFTISVSNLLAYKAIQSTFLALQVIRKFLNQLYICWHFIPNFCIKIIQKGHFGHFLQWNPF